MVSKPNLRIKQQLSQGLFQDEKKIQLKNQVSVEYKGSVLRLIAHLKETSTNK